MHSFSITATPPFPWSIIFSFLFYAFFPIPYIHLWPYVIRVDDKALDRNAAYGKLTTPKLRPAACVVNCKLAPLPSSAMLSTSAIHSILHSLYKSSVFLLGHLIPFPSSFGRCCHKHDYGHQFIFPLHCRNIFNRTELRPPKLVSANSVH